jgi:DNA-binding CsgD family transcriptional regulator
MVLSLVQFLLNIDKIAIDKMPQNGGLVLAIICIMLSGSKLLGDMKKLFHPEIEPEKVGIPIVTLGLTPREQEVAQLLVQGKTYKEMAAELFVSLPTVKTHVSNIYAKANVRNRLELSNLLMLFRNNS